MGDRHKRKTQGCTHPWGIKLPAAEAADVHKYRQSPDAGQEENS